MMPGAYAGCTCTCGRACAAGVLLPDAVRLALRVRERGLGSGPGVRSWLLCRAAGAVTACVSTARPLDSTAEQESTQLPPGCSGLSHRVGC